jgi:hypothetical protein
MGQQAFAARAQQQTFTVSGFCLHVALCTWLLCEINAAFHDVDVPLGCFSLRVMNVITLLTVGSILSIVVLNAHWSSVWLIYGTTTATIKAFSFLGSPIPNSIDFSDLSSFLPRQVDALDARSRQERDGKINNNQQKRRPPPYNAAWFNAYNSRTAIRPVTGTTAGIAPELVKKRSLQKNGRAQNGHNGQNAPSRNVNTRGYLDHDNNRDDDDDNSGGDSGQFDTSDHVNSPRIQPNMQPTSRRAAGRLVNKRSPRLSTGYSDWGRPLTDDRFAEA